RCWFVSIQATHPPPSRQLNRISKWSGSSGPGREHSRFRQGRRGARLLSLFCHNQSDQRKGELEMPNMNHTTDILRVKQIVIDEEGNVAKRFRRIDAEGQRTNTQLFAIHPE